MALLGKTNLSAGERLFSLEGSTTHNISHNVEDLSMEFYPFDVFKKLKEVKIVYAMLLVLFTHVALSH